MQSIIIKKDISPGILNVPILGNPLSYYAESFIGTYSPAEDNKVKEDILVVFADMPLLTSEILDKILDEHRSNENALTAAGSVYIFNAILFADMLGELPESEIDQKTIQEMITKLQKDFRKCTIYSMNEDIRLHRIGNPEKLSQAMSILKRRINKRHLATGVFILDPSTAYIGPDVVIGDGSVIYPNVYLEGETHIGINCTIGTGCVLQNMKIGNYTDIKHSTLLDSQVGEGTTIGPYAYVRPGTVIGDGCKIGDFVEIKNAVIGNNTKASHLTYIGDADVGDDVNFGCGTVVVNYDGKNKHRTTIEDNVFIGCNTNLIAPVTVKTGAYTGAGSTITDDVPRNALGIARARQINKRDWHKK